MTFQQEQADVLRAFHAQYRHTTLFIWEQPLTMALYAHLDESGKFHDGQGYICLCGYVADAATWDQFNQRWSQLLRKRHLRRVHMTQFESECKQKDLEPTDVLKEFIDLIRESELTLFSIGVDGKYFKKKFRIAGRSNADPALFAVSRILKGMRDASVESCGEFNLSILARSSWRRSARTARTAAAITYTTGKW